MLGRRGFLQLASAAVLGVLTAKVPVFAEDTAALAEFAPKAGEAVSMWVYPTRYALPVKLEGVLRGRTFTAPALPDNFTSTWMLGPERGNEEDAFDLASPNPNRDAYLAEVNAIEDQSQRFWQRHCPGWRGCIPGRGGL